MISNKIGIILCLVTVYGIQVSYTAGDEPTREEIENRIINLQYDQKIVATQNNLYDLLKEINSRLKEEDALKMEHIIEKEEEIQRKKIEAEKLKEQIKALKEQEADILAKRSNI